MLLVKLDFAVDTSGLDELERRLSDLTPVMQQVAGHLLLVARGTFDSQSDPTGARWAPLQKATERERKKLGYAPSRPILYRTGALKSSVREAFTSHTASVSSDLPYAAVHITGRKGENPMAARPFLGIGKDTAQFVTQALQAHLTG